MEWERETPTERETIHTLKVYPGRTRFGRYRCVLRTRSDLYPRIRMTG